MTPPPIPTTVSEVVRDRAQQDPGQPALIDPTGTITNAEWDQWADLVSRALSDHGIGNDDRVMYLGRNRLAYPIVLAATSRAGAGVASANWRLSARELALVIVDCTPRLVIADIEFRSVLNQAVQDSGLDLAVVWLDGETGLTDLEVWASSGGAVQSARNRADSADAIALINYTSGTTGPAKGVLITQRQLYASATRTQPVMFGTQTRFLVVLPIFHMSGALCVATIAWAGGTIVLIPDADTLELAAAVSRFNITDLMLVPTQIEMIMDHPQLSPAAFIGLRSISYGASSITRPTLQRMTDWFAGTDFVQGYGLSETTGPISVLSPADHRGGGVNLQSAGRPRPGVEVVIADPDTGRQLDTGRTGEVWTRSDQNCAGYWCRPEETAALYANDGWLRTGDQGRLVDGYLFITGRIKDMIVTAGENVYSNEVESVLVGLPGVSRACVVGLPHKKWGETVVAAVVAEPGHQLDEADLIGACRTQLAHYKCPTTIRLVAELPLNATGKVLRRLVRESLSSM